MRRTLTALLILGLIPVACSQTLDVSGSVIDQRTKQPVAGAEITSGAALKAASDGNGKFRLRGIPKDTKLKVTAPNYESSEVLPTEEPMKVSLKPIPVKGAITSNLTGSGLTAKITGKEEVQAAPDGTFTIFDVGPGDQLKITAEGYEEAHATVEETREVKLNLLADPATTFKQLTTWDANRNFDRAWEWVHPDAPTYVSKEEWIRGINEANASGYARVGVDIHEVTITTWELVCKQRGRVAFRKTYENAATLRATHHYSTPQGGGEDRPGVSHLVKTQDGKWGWFPVGNCD